MLMGHTFTYQNVHVVRIINCYSLKTGQVFLQVLLEQALSQSNPILAPVQINRAKSSVRLMRDTSGLFCLFHALIGFIVELYNYYYCCCYIFYLKSYCEKVDSVKWHF